LLSLVNVHKYFNHRGNVIEVLKGIDLTVNAGESIAIMGASGVGKSTLLNVMGSLEMPTKGVVRFQRQNIYMMDEIALCKFRNRKIGFVFQFHHLLPEFNALENVMMPALISRLPKGKVTENAVQMLKRVGLGNRMNHQVGELSGGEQQRVAIARALIMKPRLIIADEPTGNLDWLTGQEISDLIVGLGKEKGLAVIIATHNQKLAKKMSRQMEIYDGKIH
jgi:lipoprotein-releasing system ATP-binding protein